MHLTREKLLSDLGKAGLDDFDIDDAARLVDQMLEFFEALEIMGWLCLPDPDLGGTPLVLIGDGGFRQVAVQARKLMDERAQRAA